MRYPIYFRDPVACKNKYYKTYRRLRDAQDAANDLRMLLDAGKVAEVKSAKRKISLLNFEEGRLYLGGCRRRGLIGMRSTVCKEVASAQLNA